MQIANIVHLSIAALFMLAALGHIYMGTLGMAGAYDAMSKGYVDETWAKEHHLYWYNDIKAGKIPTAPDDAPAPRRGPPTLTVGEIDANHDTGTHRRGTRRRRRWRRRWPSFLGRDDRSAESREAAKDKARPVPRKASCGARRALAPAKMIRPARTRANIMRVRAPRRELRLVRSASSPAESDASDRRARP